MKKIHHQLCCYFAESGAGVKSRVYICVCRVAWHSWGDEIHTLLVCVHLYCRWKRRRWRCSAVAVKCSIK